MARIRTIKPDFWKHEELSELPCETHLLAAALLNYADDEGYFRANPKLVKAECCPLREDSVSVHESLQKLSDAGYIRLFTGSDGKQYGHIKTFLQHQRISRPSESKIKELDNGNEDSVNAHGGFSEDSPPEGNKEQGREGSSVPNGTGRETAPDDPVKRLFDTAVEILGEADVKPKHARSKIGQWRKSYNDGEIFNALIQARKESAVEPIAYVEKTLQERSGANKPFPGYVPLGVGG